MYEITQLFCFNFYFEWSIALVNLRVVSLEEENKKTVLLWSRILYIIALKKILYQLLYLLNK